MYGDVLIGVAVIVAAAEAQCSPHDVALEELHLVAYECSHEGVGILAPTSCITSVDFCICPFCVLIVTASVWLTILKMFCIVVGVKGFD